MSTAINELTIAVHRHSSTGSRYSLDEKRLEEASVEAVEDVIDESDVTRPFPIEPGEVEEPHQATVRAIVVGCALGTIVAASNIYLGLKTGFTFGAQLFGSIFGFAILKAVAKVVPGSGIFGRIFGGPFGPKENCTCQSAATATGGTTLLFAGAIPAMYHLGLLKDPMTDIGKLIALNVVSAFYGVFFAIPLRKYYIVYLKLTFPTPAAAAYTIRSLHRTKTGAAAGRKKSLALLYSFDATLVFKIVSGYVPGVIYTWHVGWTLYRLGFTSIIALENYGWVIQFTPAFFGAGMLSGINASWSFLLGSVVAWGIIAPTLVKNGLAFGSSTSTEFPLVSYQKMSFKRPEEFLLHPPPRYWLLWPGVLIMLLHSFAEIACNIRLANLNPVHLFRRRTAVNPDDEDQTLPEDLVPTSWWTIGLVCSLVVSCSILAKFFHMNVGEAILSMILGFIFSFVAVQSAGQTDVNPVSTVAKASQLILGGISKGQHMDLHSAQMLNMAGGVVAAASSGQGCDMTGDLKTGYLLRAKPRAQFIAQCCGAFLSVFLTVGLFILFSKASPCIVSDDTHGDCPYAMPSVSAWAAVALAVTLPKLPIPPSSGYTAIALGLFSVVSVIAKHWLVPKKYWNYIPNWNAIGLGFVVPQVYYAIAMGVGSIFNWFWLKRNPAGYEMYMFAISAGLLAGEGMGGVFLALLQVCGVGGSKYGSAVGCPGFEFCGD